MIVIAGKTSSGKDTIVNALVKDHGYKKMITYTTRSMREGEVNGKDYHFVTAKDFENKINSGFFAEYKVYNTIFGTWKYGSAVEDYINAEDKTVIILTPDGYRDVAESLRTKPRLIYIYACEYTIRKRLESRGDNKMEAERRLRSDKKDFNGFKNEADKIVYNNENDNIEEIVEEILDYVANTPRERVF